MTDSLADDGVIDGAMVLERLVAGPAEPVVVADFQPFSSALRLSQLVSGRAEGRPVYQVDALGVLSHGRRYISLPDLAAEAAASFARSQPPDGPAFVIGYCSAAALAVRIARLLAPARETAVVLLRPSWPDTSVVERQFEELATNLGAGQLACPELDGDPDRSVRRMAGLLDGAVAALAASQGLDDGSADVFGELLLTYRSWLAFLLACRNDSLDSWAGEIATVTVLAENPDQATVPGLAAGDFEVSPLPVLDEDNPVTPEIADLVIAELKRSSARP